MGSITRKVINKNIKVTALKYADDFQTIVKETTGFDELIRKIDTIKEYLIKVHKVEVGQKIIMSIFYWPDYLAWFFACAELGLTFVIFDYPRTKETLKKLDVFGKIDYLIHDVHYPKALEGYETTFIDTRLLSEYQYSGNSTPIWANDDSILLYTTTSGTTGSPKLIINKHNYFYYLMDRNAKLYDLKPYDRCFHSKNLHHGSVACVYFFPVIKFCENHFHAPYKFLDLSWEDGLDPELPLIKSFVNLIQQEQITRCVMFYEQIDYLSKFLDLDKKQHDEMSIYVLSKISKDNIDTLVGKFKYSLISIFGSTEVGGPLFLPSITPANYTNFNPYNMGQILDDTFELKIKDGLLNVKSPWNADTICTGDKFEIDLNNNWIFKGRDNIYKIRGSTIYLDPFNLIIEELTGLKKELDFDVVIDSVEEKIYIRSDDKLDLNYLNENITRSNDSKNYKISKNLVSPRNNYFSGLKFDPELIRIVCRKLKE